MTSTKSRTLVHKFSWWLTTIFYAPTAVKNFVGNLFILPVMEGAPSVVTPHNLVGFSSNFSTTLSTYSQMSCPVVVEERLAISTNSSTISKSAVTALKKMTSWAVSLKSVVSSEARLKASDDFNLSFKISLILSERSFVLHKTVKREKVNLLSQMFFLLSCKFCEYCQTIFNKFSVIERLSFFCHTFTKNLKDIIILLSIAIKIKHLCNIIMTTNTCPWCNGYRRRKWTQRHEFKS